MKWDIFCYYAYGVPTVFHGYWETHLPPISTNHLMVLTLDDTARIDGYKRHFLRSKDEHVVGGSNVRSYIGCYMNLFEIFPIQFYPKLLSLGTFLGLRPFDKPTRIDPNLWSLLTCKFPHAAPRN